MAEDSPGGEDALTQQLQGRIIALELVTQAFLTSYVMENFNHPINALGELKSEMFGSLQLLQRAVGPYEDAVWEESTRALELLFENVRKRVEALRDRS